MKNLKAKNSKANKKRKIPNKIKNNIKNIKKIKNKQYYFFTSSKFQ